MGKQSNDNSHILFSVKLTAKDLYGFNMYQNYTGIHGWVSIILGLFAIAVGILGLTGFSQMQSVSTGSCLLYIGIGILVIAYIPVTMWGKVKATLKTNEVLAGELKFDISSENIFVSQGEESAALLWDQVYKMVGNKNRVLIYSSRVNAYVIPRTQLGEKYAQLKILADQKLPPYRNKMGEK